MKHIVRNYTFIYYLLDCDDKIVRNYFSVECNRFTKAFHLFSHFFNGLDCSYKDYSLVYYLSDSLSSDSDFDSCREIPAKYYGYLFRSVPEV